MQIRLLHPTFSILSVILLQGSISRVYRLSRHEKIKQVHENTSEDDMTVNI